MLRSRSLALAGMVAVIALVTPQVVGSDTISELRSEREQVKAEQARVASQIDVDEASLAEIDAALQAIDENLRIQEAALARTEAEVAQAEREIEEATAAIDDLTTEISVLREELRRRAVHAYVNPPAEGVLLVLDADDAMAATSRRFYVELRARTDSEVADRLDGATKDLEHERTRAAEAREVAEAKRVEQAERAAAVREAKAQQERVAADLEARINAQISRSLELAATDRALSQKIAEEQAALAARLAAQRAAEEEAARKAAEERAAAERAAAEARSARSNEGGGSGGGGGGGRTGPPVPGGSDVGIQLAYVQGIPVNAQVADQVVAMINAASADGVTLSIGNSYRSYAQQIETRKRNCGTSHYAIYQMPASACRPPTAVPGQSQHQLGLAIDFANCSTRSTACYQWLAGNASRFGFYNLPSEPWHWSTTGR